MIYFMGTSVHHVHVVPSDSRAGMRFSRTAVRDSCVLVWVQGTNPLQEQPVLVTTEPALQPPTHCFLTHRRTSTHFLKKKKKVS